MPEEFRGVINLDVRDSVADWSPYELARAPEGAPNVLVILYDDTGLAAWSPYGGRIEMPTMQRLADNGVTYTQWHTTALCSPTRSVCTRDSPSTPTPRSAGSSTSSSRVVAAKSKIRTATASTAFVRWPSAASTVSPSLLSQA